MMKLRIKQIKSGINRKEDQKRTLQALGLKKINDIVEHEDTPAVRGMVFKVKHLIEVEEI
ncbi:MAG: 50S ribosomal protein L30 [Coriobacteriia bacterium]|nr:50S ribosomal protein L30 [Coriobacteriia bacterium]